MKKTIFILTFLVWWIPSLCLAITLNFTKPVLSGTILNYIEYCSNGTTTSQVTQWTEWPCCFIAPPVCCCNSPGVTYTIWVIATNTTGQTASSNIETYTAFKPKNDVVPIDPPSKPGTIGLRIN
jgi:hypothetical protein